MKKIVALSCVCACLTAMAGVPQLNNANVTGNRICLLHAYDWTESATGAVSVAQADEYYQGGWTVTLNAGQGDLVTVQGGFTPLSLDMPLHVDQASGTVRLTCDEPFATMTGTRSTTTGYTTTTVDSTIYYYYVNEDWVTNSGNLADVKGELQADGSIHIAGGFAIYVETVKTTTVRVKGEVRDQFTDETHTTTPLYRDTWLMVPNGKHEFTRESDGEHCVVDVCLRQDGDKVYVINLYGYGAPEAYMVLHEDGTVAYPGQMVRDIDDEMSPDGDGVWFNSNAGGTLGNEGQVTPSAITWGQTIPTDNATTWAGWNDNRLYFTDGHQFVVPGSSAGLRGDVDDNGVVSIDDVTALIDYLLSGNGANVNLTNADCDLTGIVSIDDVKTLIDYLLGGAWQN